MNGRVRELIFRHFLDKFSENSEDYIGAEIEMPVINLKKEPVAPVFLRAMVSLLEQEFGFCPVEFTLDGFPVKSVSRGGDAFSFETGFNTIEFSMAKKKSVTELAGEFYRYLRALKKLEIAYGHLICGTGINPYAQYADPRHLNTPVMRAKSEFLRKFTTHHDGEIFHAFSASTQTHLDVNRAELPDMLNLLNKLSFADAALFANSLPFFHERASFTQALPQSLRDGLDKPVLCYRDILWKLCEAPNTQAFEGEFLCVGDIANHMSKLKVFIVNDENGAYQPIRPISFSDYFSDATKPEGDIQNFRSLEPVAVSRYGTIEIRQTCTQPLSEVFAPVAFYAGIAKNQRKALELTDDFLRENKISQSGAQLRYKAVCQEEIAPQDTISRFLTDLLTVSEQGLKTRNFGEEKYLGRLTGKMETVECPAKKQLRMQSEGASQKDMILEYAKTI